MILETFLNLTRQTYPHGTEHQLRPFLPDDVEQDEFGNYFLQIGESDVMFTAHLDTCSFIQEDVRHVIRDGFVFTDGRTILGADDKAGVTVMLHMIQNDVPGLYYFFIGEEIGCVGSGNLAAQHRRRPLPHLRKVVSFDRRKTGAVITFQSGVRCCSDEFANALSVELNLAEPTFLYAPDRNGLFTDSMSFIDIYPECTNVSVGYEFEHSTSERLDIGHLQKLAEACCKVRWSELPVARDPDRTEYCD